MSTDPLTQAFLEEAGELLADFESGLLQLETAPDDPELLNRIFRSAHTLKGNSAMLGFEAIAHFTHVLEDLLDQLRKGRRQVTPRVVDALLRSGDVVRALLARAQTGEPGGETGGPVGGDEAGAAGVVEALQALIRDEEPPATVPVQPAGPAAAPEAVGVRTLYEINFRPPRDLLRRGLDPVQVIHQLGELGELVRVVPEIRDLPPLDAMDPELCYLTWQIWLLGSQSRAEVEAVFDFVADPAALTIEGLPMGEESPARTGAREGSGGPEEPARPGEPSPTAGESRRAARVAAAAEAASIRVPIDKVDRLINLVGELVITQSMVAEAVGNFTPERLPALLEAVGQMDRHARELHERIMAVRMLPIKTVFSRFPRVVRDLAAAGGKQAALQVSGEETELDKTVIERIGDPLTHLVRNATDHGLEPPEARRAAGKPEVGRVRLNAYQQGGSIYVEVGDDGRGLDRDRLLAKAVQQGLVAPDQALTDEDVFALIFRPGFSTAEKVTEVSGRGVGMDVVRRNVEALGGAISILSERGRGTTFRIKLPLTLAILDGQSLAVGEHLYIIPLISIIESVRPEAGSVHAIAGSGETVVIRGRVLPLVRLHRLFGVTPRSEDPLEGLVVLVEHEGRNAALLVDELLGQQQVVIKSLETNFQRIDGVAGATILGDGRVALILDVPGLIGLARGRERGPVRRAQAALA